MDKKKYLQKYFDDLRKIITFDDKKILDLIKVSEIITKANNIGKKTLIFGNGGSAAIASHFSVDLTKNARIRCVNFNESDLLTCFSNDFGYEKWVEKCIEYYGDEHDVVILISAGGNSENMINGANEANALGIPLVTFSGFSSNNKLRDLGQLNFWVNSSSYNIVENVHQVWLLSIIDFLIDSNTSDGVIV